MDTVKTLPGCKVSPLVRSIFFGQNVDLTSGLHCTQKSLAQKKVFYREVQLDFTTEIEFLYILFEMFNSKNRKGRDLLYNTQNTLIYVVKSS